MIILDRLPIADRPHLINVRGELVDIYRSQIVVWVSIADARRPFPALLDTGHGHNFSISGGQLRRWSGAALGKIVELEIGKTRVSQFRAEMNLHANVGAVSSCRAGFIAWRCPRESPSSMTGRRTHQGSRSWDCGRSSRIN